MAQGTCRMCGSDVLVYDNYCRKCGVQLTRPGRTMGEWVDRRFAIGAFFVTSGSVVATLSYLMAVFSMLALGLACFLIGILIVFLPESDRSIASSLATITSIPSLLNIENLLEDLDLDGEGIYLPTTGLGVCPRVYVPSTKSGTIKPPAQLATSRRIFVTVGGNPEDRGILLDAPGSQILSTVERALRTDLAGVGLENLGSALNSGLRTVGIAKDVALQVQDSNVVLEVELNTFLDLEVKLQNLAPRLIAQVGSPVTSATVAATSKAAGKYATLKSAVLDLRSKKVRVNVKLSS